VQYGGVLGVSAPHQSHPSPLHVRAGHQVATNEYEYVAGSRHGPLALAGSTTEQLNGSGNGPGSPSLRHMPRLLVVHHSPTRSLQGLTEAVVAGAHDPELDGVEVVVRPALEATADDVLDADGYVLGTSANFGYMSGALKHFFDSTFLQIGGALDEKGGAASTGSTNNVGATAKRPYGLYVHGRYDLTGAIRSVQSIVGALGWKQGYDVLGVLGPVEEQHTEAAYELGATIAALVAEAG